MQLAASGVLGSQISKVALSAIAEPPRSLANLTSDLKRQGISVILPGDPGYDIARSVWDRRVDKKPAAILGCASVAHIQEALRFCAKERLPIAIRGGGHGFSGHSTIDGGLLIDLAAMYEVKLDVPNRTVTVGPGVRTGYLLGITTSKDLAPVTTTDNHIGAALFAGQGYLSPLYGNMCDNVSRLEVVLADGRLITVSAEEHPDLF
jgi:FAD/FMN-containing dehydrogenase